MCKLWDSKYTQILQINADNRTERNVKLCGSDNKKKLYGVVVKYYGMFFIVYSKMKHKPN